MTLPRLFFVIVFVFVLYNILKKKESFDNETHITKQELAEKILSFMNADTTFSEYLNYISGTTNLSYNLVKPNIFYEMKGLLKQGLLTSNIIVEYMSDFKDS